MTELYMAVAGIRVRVVCADYSLIDVLKVRYRHFIVEPGTAAYDVHFALDSKSPPQTYISPAFAYEEHRIIFDLPGYSGIIDRDDSASLQIASETPTNGVDYFLRVVFALLSYKSGGLMIHAAGIVRNARAFLFFGHSGSGKTTVARNSGNDLVLSDDLIILMPEDTHWRAYGSPFTNPTQIQPTQESAPVAALLRLVHSPKVYLEPLEGAAAVAELVSSVPVMNSSPAPPLDRCRQILLSVPAYRLHLRPDPSFWSVIEEL